MHCNLRPPNAQTVLIRFSYDAHAKFEVAQQRATYPLQSYDVFTVDTLRYVVIFTFDFSPGT